MRAPIFLLVIALTGCLGSLTDQPDRIRVDDRSNHEGEVTFRLLDPDGVSVDERNWTLKDGSGRPTFMVDLTSEVRYTGEALVGNVTLRSEPFFTGLGEWRVDFTLLDDELRVSTLHGD